jgi:hypothetical protein
MTNYKVLMVMLLVACGVASAAPLRGLSGTQASVATTATTNSVVFKGTTGKPLAISVSCATNVSIRMQTVVGYGSSLASAKVILVSTNLPAGLGRQLNVASDIFLYQDRVTVDTWSAGAIDVPVRFNVILDTDN